MSQSPLVSIMIPCFNAADTLPMALASLLSQTYPHWEALIVDDGSTDGTRELVQGVDDARFRVFRFDTNMGRGIARQKALDEARGDYLCFLDADDWYFPEKLRAQIELFEQYPELNVQSCEAVITDASGCAIGMTAEASLEPAVHREGYYERLAPPPILFPPSMLRMKLAKTGRFNPKLLRSQDSDYLMQVMHEQSYLISSVPLYAYSQGASASGRKTLRGYRYRIQSYVPYLREHPLRGSWMIGKTLLKASVYGAAMATGQEHRFIERRWSPVQRGIAARFSAAQEPVESMLEATFEPAAHAAVRHAIGA